MGKRLKIILAVGLLTTIVLLVSNFKTTSQTTKATVTKVSFSPNIDDDGAYIIYAKSDGGKEITINATGYMNLPLMPSDIGEACVNAPKVKEGDKIMFNLPPLSYSTSHSKNAYGVCYKSDSKNNYFLRKTL